jgi:hypothetical protein
MRTRSRSRLLLAPVALSVALLAACGDDDGDDDDNDAVEDVVQDVEDAAGEAGDDAAEAIARNIAAQQGEDEFEAAGVDVEDELACEAVVTDAADAVEITCTGTSEDGRELALQGVTSEIPGASVTELEGNFAGTADGEEVFLVDTLGG